MATLECKEIKYCYGIKDIENLTIQFQNNDNPTDEYSNSAIIYAPNGTMKSSFAKLFLDIRNGEQPTDQIFTNNHSSYNISYDKKNYIFDEKHNVKDKVKNIYVIKSFENSFNVPKVSTKLMVDEKTKHKYDMIVEQYANIIQQFKDKIKNKMQLNKTHTNIEKDIINDFGLSLDSDWPDIFEKLHNELINIQFDLSCLDRKLQ